MQNRQSWKRHVFRDLRPYVCTFEDCQNAGKLFVSHHDWIYHELQIHRREYARKECHKTCSSRKGLSTHVRAHYGESITPAQLGVILDLCDRQVDVSDHEDSCLVCGETLSLSSLQIHLAAHMEDMALFVLPSADEEGEAGCSKASVQVAKRESKGKTSGTESEASSLGFSAAGGHGQTPADFAELLTSDEAGYSSKCSYWRTTDEDQGSASTKAMAAQLEDEDADVRRAAVQALGSQSAMPDEILEAVAARLEDEDEDVRRAAIQAFGGHRDQHGRTPLSWAAEKGHMVIVKRLLVEAGIDKEAKDVEGLTPLHWATRRGHLDIARLLVEAGAEKVAKDSEGRTPLHWAAVRGNEAVIRLLAEAGADKEIKDDSGLTPLHLAAKKGHGAAARLLT